MTAKFNVTIIQPPGYVHAQALGEVWIYLADVLRRCGYDARASINELTPHEHNVLLCGHLLSAEQAACVPRNTIVFNSEKLEQSDGWYLQGAYGDLIRRYTVWDYAARNIACIPHQETAQIPFYFSPALKKRYERVRGGPLVFYGCITERRQAILQGLQAAGVPVAVLPFGCYGDARDRLIYQALAVLNLHTDAERKVFEPVRCFHPLINGIAVVTEEFHDEPMFDVYREAAFTVRDPVADIVALVADRAAFEEEAARRIALFHASNPLPDVSRAVERYLSVQGLSQASLLAS